MNKLKHFDKYIDEVSVMTEDTNQPLNFMIEFEYDKKNDKLKGTPYLFFLNLKHTSLDLLTKVTQGWIKEIVDDEAESRLKDYRESYIEDLKHEHA